MISKVLIVARILYAGLTQAGVEEDTAGIAKVITVEATVPLIGTV